MLRRSVRLLAQLTRQVAVVQYPTLSRSTGAAPRGRSRSTPARLLLVVITDSGRVDQRVVDLGDVLTDDDVAALRALLNGALVGRPLAAASRRPSPSCPLTAPGELRGVVTVAVDGAARDAWSSTREERLVLGGTANLTRNAADFPRLAAPGAGGARGAGGGAQAARRAQDPGTVTVRIGEENEAEQMRATSVVSIGYGASTVLGGMGVVGPTRMDYPGTIAAVHAVARYVGEILAGR